MHLLEAKNIAHSFDYPLFKNIDVSLSPKESLAIVGVSGSGKSTLLHICSTLLEPQHGEVKLFGNLIYHKKNRKTLQDIRRNHIGIVFQFHYLFKGFTALENIEVASLLSRQPIDENLIQAFGIGHVIEKKVTELSGGEQQRVSIARVLTKKPKIVFADEPTGNLDQKTAQEVMDRVFEYIKTYDAGLFLVTHDMDLAMRCDAVYKLEERKLKKVKG
ncbi:MULTISPECIES: ABC transporter ATP-binding protein [unclassified Nitratiruptor]|uniref:ABC transporter ATP-binding protein n=1 Tax=unclassified Nitratiruptor TaxID=2624044 RepID=UPI0019164279|nr:MULTISPECIES: ABC transporter ATP-binding protein [unclassified Nitratiruptor]BCD60838.1 putative ABC transport system ATP-binding protein [Nitratiruptor sp. YY08-10]BCD64770.1 putative ABC transport system ATP-binding protein [Nitratiruptor sp. YY08-14]